MAAPEMDMPMPIPARVATVDELLRRFRDSKRSFWIAFVEHKLLVKEHERDPTFEESRSRFLEPMAFYNAEMSHTARELAARGEAVPSREAAVVSLFLDPRKPDEDAHDPAPPDEERGALPDSDVEGGLAPVPLRESREAAWHRVDASYLLAWFQQTLFVAEHPEATDAEVTSTPFTSLMLLRGRALERIESRLVPLGWVRPPPRLASQLFPSLCVDL